MVVKEFLFEFSYIVNITLAIAHKAFIKRMDIGDLVKTRKYSSKRTRKEPKRFPYGIYSWADHLNNFIRSRLKPLSCKKTA